MFYVEERDFLEDLKNKKYVQLNEDGIEKVVKIIEEKDNIINELEKWLEDYIKLFDNPDVLEEQTAEDLKEVLNKIKELKGDKNNE